MFGHLWFWFREIGDRADEPFVLQLDKDVLSVPADGVLEDWLPLRWVVGLGFDSSCLLLLLLGVALLPLEIRFVVVLLVN